MVPVAAIMSYMNVTITELRAKLNEYLRKNGLADKDVHTLTDLVVEQELVGNQFDPLAELPGRVGEIVKYATALPEAVIDKPSVKLVKGNGRFAPLITADYLEEMVSAAKRQGIFAFGLYDSTYNDFFAVFCQRIAARDCIAIIVENGGPQGVVPFGGKKDVLGTNPLAYGVPTQTSPIVFDAATAMYAYGRIRQAKERHEQLPDDAFLDDSGAITTDPEKAVAILPFGGYKGYAINLLVDILSGALVRGKSGLDQPLDSARYIGTLIVVIDPASFGDLKAFKDATSKLTDDLLAVPPSNPAQPVRVPGFRGAARRQADEAAGTLEISDEVWHQFIAAAEN